MKTQLLLVLVIVFILILAYNSTPKAYYSDEHPILDEVRNRFRVISPEYGKIPLKLGDKSYTEDKKVITLCIVDPNTNSYYDMNTIMYVALHELGHVITPRGEEAHGKVFKENFASLLKQAQTKRVYDSTKPIPVEYCGTGPDID